jgi:hypothetical protein
MTNISWFPRRLAAKLELPLQETKDAFVALVIAPLEAWTDTLSSFGGCPHWVATRRDLFVLGQRECQCQFSSILQS